MKTEQTSHLSLVLTTALVPVIWGSTYLATTEWLPPDRPFTAAVIRALPAGLILVLMGREKLPLQQLPSILTLSLLNITLFQGLLFTAAYLLPGGIAAVVGAIQPLLIMLLSWLLDKKTPAQHKILVSIVAVGGMALLFAEPDSQWNLVGLIAAFIGTTSMAVGVYLSGKWTHEMSTLSYTGWQLLIGGILPLPVAVITEEPIQNITATNIFGYVYICVFGALIGYSLWFRGIKKLSPAIAASLGLLSPLTATLLGWVFLNEQLGLQESAGLILVLASIFVLQQPAPPKPLPATIYDPVEIKC